MKNGRILNFPLNLPAVVTLGSSEHTIVQGRYGDRALFTLADGRSMYVPPIFTIGMFTDADQSGPLA